MRNFLFLAICLVVGVMLFLLDPATSPCYPNCLFNALTGWRCPGCGSLRAMHHLLHGRWGMALEMNALLTLSSPLLFWHGVVCLHNRRFSPPWRSVLERRWLQACLFCVTFLFAVLRNMM